MVIDLEALIAQQNLYPIRHRNNIQKLRFTLGEIILPIVRHLLRAVTIAEKLRFAHFNTQNLAIVAHTGKPS